MKLKRVHFYSIAVGVVVILAACSTVPLYTPSTNLSDAQVAQCLEYQNQTRVMAERGDRQEQFELGRKLFIGCTEGRVKNPAEALAWLEKAAKQDDLAANAFLGKEVFGSTAIRKFEAGQDWVADEAQAIRYTDKAIEIWERAGRKGFEKFELDNLSAAVNNRGLIQKRIHDDKVGAVKYYCLAIRVTDDIGRVKTIDSNLKGVGKTQADCK